MRVEHILDSILQPAHLKGHLGNLPYVRSFVTVRFQHVAYTHVHTDRNGGVRLKKRKRNVEKREEGQSARTADIHVHLCNTHTQMYMKNHVHRALESMEKEKEKEKYKQPQQHTKHTAHMHMYTCPLLCTHTLYM